MSLGGFAAGFAQAFDGAKFGRSINEGIADYKENKAKEAAEEKKKKAIADLDLERFQSGGAPQGEQVQLSTEGAPQVDLSAVPNPSAQAGGPVAQGQAIDPQRVVTAKDVKPGNPMADTTYDKRLQAINDSYDNDVAQARADYYRFRGMNKEQEEAEKKLENMKFAQQFGMLHKNALDGDPNAMGQLVGYMNASMGNGMEIQMGEGGKMSLLQNGQVVQKDFVPTRAQIDQAAVSMYNTAKFLRGGDFDKYLQNMTSIKGLDLSDKKYALDTAKFDEQKRAASVAENQGQQKIDNDMYNAGADRALKKYGIDATVSTADKDRASRERVAAEDRTARKAIADNRDATTLAVNKSNNETTVATTQMGIDAKAALQKDAQAHAVDMQKSDHAHSSAEAEKSRAFSAEQKGLDRAHAKGIADDKNALTRYGMILDHTYNQGKLGLEREKLNMSKEELAWKKSLEEDKKNGLKWEVSNDGYIYARYGKEEAPTAYRTSLSGPKIPVGMSEESYNALAEKAKRHNVVAGTVLKKDGTHVIAYQLPNGGLTEDLEEAIAAQKGGAK